MEHCVESLGLEIARRKHYNQILDITKGENLYNGMDYLPFALENWLDEAENEESNRLNVIYTLDAKVVGFRSVYFLNNKKVAVRFAFRIQKDIRGKGLVKVRRFLGPLTFQGISNQGRPLNY